MLTIIVIVIFILLFSAILSGIEASLFSISMGKVMALNKQKKKGSEALLKIKEKINRSITVLVILTNIVNVAGSALVGAMAGKELGDVWLGMFLGLVTFFIIVFGEIIPKSIGENYAEKVSLTVAKPLLFLTKVFTPVVKFFEEITNRINSKKNLVSEDEIKILSHLGHLEGSIEKDEKEIIQNVFRLNDLRAKDIMTPRTVVVSFDEDKTLEELKWQIYNLCYSRIPVFKEDSNNITGVCLAKELLIALGKDEINRKISEFKHEIIFVSSKAKVDYLLILFKKKKSHLAVVRDNYGTTLGVVTLEDVLEQLVGEIVDESDETVDLQEKAREISDGL